MRLEDGCRMWLEVTPLPSASRGREQAVKIMEEAGEVFAASDRLDADLARWIQVLQLDPRAWMAGEKGRMLEDELADLITAAAGLAQAWRLDLPSAMERCRIRNQERGRLQ